MRRQSIEIPRAWISADAVFEPRNGNWSKPDGLWHVYVKVGDTAVYSTTVDSPPGYNRLAVEEEEAEEIAINRFGAVLRDVIRAHESKD